MTYKEKYKKLNQTVVSCGLDQLMNNYNLNIEEAASLLVSENFRLTFETSDLLRNGLKIKR